VISLVVGCVGLWPLLLSQWSLVASYLAPVALSLTAEANNDFVIFRIMVIAALA